MSLGLAAGDILTPHGRRFTRFLSAEAGCCYSCIVRDPCWIKSRIAARILLRANRGSLRSRDRRLARRLAGDAGVTDRLIDQALACLCAEKGVPEADYHALLRATLAAHA